MKMALQAQDTTTRAGEKGLMLPQLPHTTLTKTRKSARTRASIIQAATELVVEQGNAHFQMAELAERCGISKGALYYYFRDRDAIVEEVFSASVSQLNDRLATSMEGADSATEALYALCHEFVSCVKEGGLNLIALADDLGRSGASLLPQLESRLGRIVDLIGEQIERAQGEGVVRANVNARTAAAGICGMFLIATVDAALLNENADIDIDALTNDLVDYVVRGVAVTEPPTKG